jgi:peptidoglycan lytic transglycosylase
MRPFWHTRAWRATAAVGVPTAVIALGAIPALASSSTQTASAVAPAPVHHRHHEPIAHAARATVSIHHRRLNIVAGRHATVSGTVLPRGRGHIVVLQRAARGRWVTIDRDATNRTGRFRLSGRVDRLGTSMLRVRVRPDTRVRAGGRLVGHLNVFRPVFVSWYGPGLFGGPLACGGTLGFGTMGVANRTLPCGTMVTLRYRGRSVRVPVIDRGPFVGGREYDLSEATRNALRFGDLGTVLATR